jgi:branched-chain amino acid transport system substrate-binding protein
VSQAVTGELAPRRAGRAGPLSPAQPMPGVRQVACGVASFLLLLSPRVEASPPAHSAVPPFRDANRVPQEYAGPGRDALPTAYSELVLGWFAPSDPDHPEGGDAWRGASLAVEEANAAGGIGGRPLRLLARWADDPWRSGAANASRLVYEDGALALLGSIDGAATHLAEQVAVKTRLPLLSPLSTDPSVNLAGVPWMLSCLPGDDRIAPRLIEAVTARSGSAPLVLIVATDHDSRITGGEVRKTCSLRGIAIARLVEVTSAESLEEAVQGALDARPGALIVAAPSRIAGQILTAVRAKGFAGPAFGSAPLGRLPFLRAAGPAAEGVVVPCLHEPGPLWDAFTARWEARFGSPPDDTAGQSYDAVRMTAEALSRSGPNRALLLDALRALTPWTGIMGRHTWDNLGRNQRPVRLAAWRSGRLVPLN